MRKPWISWLVCGIGAGIACPSDSQGQLARSVQVVLENDYFVFWIPPQQRTDDNYSQGARISVDLPGSIRLVPRRGCRGQPTCGATYEIGQELYTPTVDAPQPLPGERPYAGWLYARAATRMGSEREFRDLGLTVGLTGKASFAEAVQTRLHRRIAGFRAPLGWAHQLPTEVAFALRGSKAWRVSPSSGRVSRIDFLSGVDVTAGTLRTAAAGSGRLRVGTSLPHPWLSSANAPVFSLRGFVGARAEVVARDLFLDGSTFRHSHSVDREPVILSWEQGVAVTVRRLLVEYRAVFRSREYLTGPETHAYGSVTISWLLR